MRTSRGPNSPPRRGIALQYLENDLNTANPTIDCHSLVSIHIPFKGNEKGNCTPKIFAPDVHPDFRPRYILEAFTSPPQSRPTRMALNVKIFLSSSGKSSNERNGSAASASALSSTSGKSLLSSASSSMASSSEESSEDVEYLSLYESSGLFLSAPWRQRLGRHCYVLVGSLLIRNALLLLGV